MSEGAARNREGGQTAWLAATNDYVDAAEIWKLLSQPRREAQAKFSAAMIAHSSTKDRPRSVELAAEAAKLYADLGDEAPAAKAIYLQARRSSTCPGSAEDKESQYARALTLYTQAAAIQTRLGRIYDFARTTNAIGARPFQQNDWRNARSYLTESATSFRSVSEWSGELYPLGNLRVSTSRKATSRRRSKKRNACSS